MSPEARSSGHSRTARETEAEVATDWHASFENLEISEPGSGMGHSHSQFHELESDSKTASKLNPGAPTFAHHHQSQSRFEQHQPSQSQHHPGIASHHTPATAVADSVPAAIGALEAENSKLGVWQLVVRQTSSRYGGGAFPRKGGLRLSVDNFLSPNYCALDEIEQSRGEDGMFELMLRWPKTGDWPGLPGWQHWKQASNPAGLDADGTRQKGCTEVQGYMPITCAYLSMEWGGLKPDCQGRCLTTGSRHDGDKHGLWFYSVGAHKEWKGGIPGPSGRGDQHGAMVVHCVELWVKVPHDAALFIPVDASVPNENQNIPPPLPPNPLERISRFSSPQSHVAPTSPWSGGNMHAAPHTSAYLPCKSREHGGGFGQHWYGEQLIRRSRTDNERQRQRQRQ